MLLFWNSVEFDFSIGGLLEIFFANNFNYDWAWIFKVIIGLYSISVILVQLYSFLLFRF